MAPSACATVQPKHRYQDDGAQLILDAAAKAVEKLKSLPPGRKETYAASFDDFTSKLITRADEITSSGALLPAQLPDPLPKPNVKFNRGVRRRGYTAREAAEEDESDRRRAQVRRNREAEARLREDQIWSAENVAAHTAARTHLPGLPAANLVGNLPTASSAGPSQNAPLDVIEISSDESLEIDLPDNTRALQRVKTEGDDDDMDALVDFGWSDQEFSSPSSSEFSNLETQKLNRLLDNYSVDQIIQPPVPSEIQESSAATTSRRERKHWSQVLPNSSMSTRKSRRPTQRFESQHARDVALIEMKEQRRRQRQEQANRTGTGRGVREEAQAQVSQLLDDVVLPFRSSQ